MVFETEELVEDLISRTRTQTGQSVTTSILDRVFEVVRQVGADLHTACRITRDELLPQWKYKALPTPGCYREVIVTPFLTNLLHVHAEMICTRVVCGTG